MSIAKPEQSALGLPNLDPTVRAPMTNVAKYGYRQVITKILVSAAIVLGSCFVAAAPASADPNPSDTDPNPFGALTCSCQETAPAGSPALREEINRGIRKGASATW
jgi:hypothetical protein